MNTVAAGISLVDRLAPCIGSNKKAKTPEMMQGLHPLVDGERFKERSASLPLLLASFHDGH